MILTRTDAKRFLQKTYGSNFNPRITTVCQIGVRSVIETNLGFPTYAWRSLANGQDSAVKIGKLNLDCTINWEI